LNKIAVLEVFVGAEEQPQFRQSFASGFNVSIVSLLNSEQTFDNSSPALYVSQSIEPDLKRFISGYLHKNGGTKNSSVCPSTPTLR
jgi:hypothetical protein